jgi:hypothetical protein
MSECMSIGSLPSTGRGADHIENMSSVILYYHSARTTAEKKQPVYCCVMCYHLMV